MSGWWNLVNIYERTSDKKHDIRQQRPAGPGKFECVKTETKILSMKLNIKRQKNLLTSCKGATGLCYWSKKNTTPDKGTKSV